ncbi:gamma-glutamyl hydrolase-like [Saccoglossus kowalevskii]
MSDCVTTNDEPIIGILTMKTDGKKAEHGDTFIPACFVKYLESAGARVVPIFLNQSPSYYKHIFDSINGILFPGGDVDLITSDAAEAGKILYEHAIQANDKGDIFPIWGTCWGFQFLFALACGEDLLTSTPALRVSFPLIFQKGYETSKLFKNAPDDIIDILANQNVTFNAHNDGITPTTFERNEKVKNFYKMLAINMDKINKEFISMIEAYEYPFYGSQWHPEINSFEFSPRLGPNINHSLDGIKISQYMANFFVNEARKNLHTFKDKEEEARTLIYNYPASYTAEYTGYQQCYYFQ